MKKAAIEISVKSREGDTFKAGVIDLGKGKIVIWTAFRKTKENRWRITTAPYFEPDNQKQEEKKWHKLISSGIADRKKEKKEGAK